MFTSIAHFLNTLVFLDLTLAILCCILLIKLPMKYGFKYLVIPIILLSTYVLLVDGEGMLGRPYDKIPTEQFEFLDYRITRSNGQKKIEVWIIQDRKSRLYVIDYSESTDRELAKAKHARNQGQKVLGEFGTNKSKKKPEDKDIDRGFENSLNIEIVPPERILPPKNE